MANSVEQDKPNIVFKKRIQMEDFLNCSEDQFLCIIDGRSTRIIKVSEYKSTPFDEIESAFLNSFIWEIGVSEEFEEEYDGRN